MMTKGFILPVPALMDEIQSSDYSQSILEIENIACVLDKWA